MYNVTGEALDIDGLYNVTGEALDIEQILEKTKGMLRKMDAMSDQGSAVLNNLESAAASWYGEMRLLI